LIEYFLLLNSEWFIMHFQLCWFDLQHLGPVPSSRVKLTRRLTFNLTLG